MKVSKYLLAAAACNTFVINPVLSKCCYTLSSQTLASASSSSYAISLSISSQSAVESSGKIYKAIIKFSSTYLISAPPTGCNTLSRTSVSCESSGQNLLTVLFPNITQLDDPSLLSLSGHAIQKRQEIDGFGLIMAAPSSANNVTVNGETCTVNTTCPALTGITGIHSSSASTPTPATKANTDSSSSSSSDKSMIIGVSCGVVAVILLACCVVLRRNMTSASALGLKRGESQYSLGQPSDNGTTAAYGGPNSYALYREKTLRRQKSVREFHEAVAAMTVTSQRDRESTLPKEVRAQPNFADIEVGYPGTIEAMVPVRHPSRKSTRSIPSEKVREHGMPSVSLRENVASAGNEYPVGNGRNSLLVPRVDDNESKEKSNHATKSFEQRQNAPLKKSRSARYPWAQTGERLPSSASSSSPALVSVPISRQEALDRNASMRMVKSGDSANGRSYHQVESIDPLQQKQLPQRSHPGLRSEPISLASWTPQALPVIPKRSPSRREQNLTRTESQASRGHISRQIEQPDDRAGTHGLYGYL
ncbi:hypothetical protein BGX27_005236 [Mortierella sp. AM989]|nr:hypothetical protein BGX27_005236 [Mortierella sp. AM989]